MCGCGLVLRVRRSGERSRALTCTFGLAKKASHLARAASRSVSVEPEQNREKLLMRKAPSAKVIQGLVGARAARAWAHARYQSTPAAPDQRLGRANRPAQAGVEQGCS